MIAHNRGVPVRFSARVRGNRFCLRSQGSEDGRRTATPEFFVLSFADPINHRPGTVQRGGLVTLAERISTAFQTRRACQVGGGE